MFPKRFGPHYTLNLTGVILELINRKAVALLRVSQLQVLHEAGHGSATAGLKRGEIIRR